jgi:hypothetical protein
MDDIVDIFEFHGVVVDPEHCTACAEYAARLKAAVEAQAKKREQE